MRPSDPAHLQESEMTIKGWRDPAFPLLTVFRQYKPNAVGGKTTRGAVRRLHQGVSDSEVYQDDHVPEGARPNRWQSLHFVCRYEHHHKPVYSLQRHSIRVQSVFNRYVFDAWNYTPL